MRQAGRIVAEVLALVESELKPGVSTGHLDRLAERYIRRSGRHAVVQGLPRRRKYGKGRTHTRPARASRSTTRSSTGSRASGTIRDGQIVSVDAGAIVEGWHGDGARTFIVGEVDAERPRARRRDPAAMMAGIAAAVPGNRIGDISAAVEDVGRAARLRHRPPVRRPRHRHGDARGAAGPELPHRLARHAARARDLPRDRADVHARQRRGRTSSPTAGPS